MGPKSHLDLCPKLFCALLLVGLLVACAGQPVAMAHDTLPNAAGERIYLPLTVTLGAISATQQEAGSDEAAEGVQDGRQIPVPTVYDDCGVPLDEQVVELGCATETAEE